MCQASSEFKSVIWHGKWLSFGLYPNHDHPLNLKITKYTILCKDNPLLIHNKYLYHSSLPMSKIESLTNFVLNNYALTIIIKEYSIIPISCSVIKSGCFACYHHYPQWCSIRWSESPAGGANYSLVAWQGPASYISRGSLVDRPTQLICISEIDLLFICQQTNTKDMAGASQLYIKGEPPLVATWG